MNTPRKSFLLWPIPMQGTFALFMAGLVIAPAQAAVLVSVQESNGVAVLKYECTAGEVVQSFALDVRVDQGRILGISNFFKGESVAGNRGYGIFPAAFRDHLTVAPGADPDWNVSGYTPLAVVADKPDDTLPGLNSSGVTLEFAGLWDASVPASVPPATGILCALQISEAAQVSVAANASRGGVLSAQSGASLETEFIAAFVDPSPIITGIWLADATIQISFKGGELETAPTVHGPWTGTGNSSGTFTVQPGANGAGFYRVRRQQPP